MERSARHWLTLFQHFFVEKFDNVDKFTSLSGNPDISRIFHSDSQSTDSKAFEFCLWQRQRKKVDVTRSPSPVISKDEDLVRCDATRPKTMHNGFLVELSLWLSWISSRNFWPGSSPQLRQVWYVVAAALTPVFFLLAMVTIRTSL